MPRLTITLSKERHRALKETAARTGKTIGKLIDESLDRCGIKSIDRVARLIDEARRNAGLTEDEAMELALRETRAVRKERAARERARRGG